MPRRGCVCGSGGVRRAGRCRGVRSCCWGRAIRAADCCRPGSMRGGWRRCDGACMTWRGGKERGGWGIGPNRSSPPRCRWRGRNPWRGASGRMRSWCCGGGRSRDSSGCRQRIFNRFRVKSCSEFDAVSWAETGAEPIAIPIPERCWSRSAAPICIRAWWRTDWPSRGKRSGISVAGLAWSQWFPRDRTACRNTVGASRYLTSGAGLAITLRPYFVADRV